MSRIYLIDCNGVSHWQWHASATDAQGNERTLAEKVTEWWRQFC